MRIVYYTTGITGWGRVVIGTAIGNAIKRKSINCEFIILSSSNYEFLSCGFKHLRIPVEDEDTLSRENYSSSVLYDTLTRLDPDILITDLVWYSTYYFIDKLPCKKIFLIHQVHERFFSMKIGEKELVFKPEHYDLVLGIEPFKSIIEMNHINPIVFRNRDEILTREDALAGIGVNTDKEICFFSISSKAPNFSDIKNKYSYLESEYKIIYSHEYEKGLFPEIDYYNAFDFIICGGGYNQFWSLVYFDKSAAIEPLPLNFENHLKRINECRNFTFKENGADQLVSIIMNL